MFYPNLDEVLGQLTDLASSRCPRRKSLLFPVAGEIVRFYCGFPD
jgi:hypothetical protein